MFKAVAVSRLCTLGSAAAVKPFSSFLSPPARGRLPLQAVQRLGRMGSHRPFSLWNVAGDAPHSSSDALPGIKPTDTSQFVDMTMSSMQDYRCFLNPEDLASCEREYCQRHAAQGDRFLNRRHAEWALFLSKQFLKRREYSKVFEYARDCIVMNMGHDSKEFKLLQETNWFKDSPDPFMEVAHVLARSAVRPAEGHDTLNKSRLLAARSLYFLGRYSEAAQFFTAGLLGLLDTNVDYKEIFVARRMLSLCYRRSGHMDHAILILEDGIREAANSPTTQAAYYADIGATCIEAQRFNAAYDAYTKCIQLRQKDEDPIVSLGIAQALEGLGNQVGAQVAFETAAEQAATLFPKKRAELWLSYLKFLKNNHGNSEAIARVQHNAQKALDEFHQRIGDREDDQIEFHYVDAPVV